MAQRLKVVFLWHMHQPYYKDYFSGEYILPWVRLHGTKDYLDMVSILDQYPKIKQTFNYVPSLLKQIDDYVENNAVDRQLYLSSKKCDQLTDSEKQTILKTFFSANYPTMIQLYPEYDRLYQKRKPYLKELAKAVPFFSNQEYLDLTVLANLAWIDPSFRTRPEIKALFRKGRNYTYEDRDLLFAFQKEILRQIVPKSRELQDRGQIEISFSPYYHPILPLLINTDLALEAMPRAKLPTTNFVHPEDARIQIQKSMELYQHLFGHKLRGMWPSEGSVAEKLLPILAECGVEWIATDEEIFYSSLEQSKAQMDISSIGQNFHRPFILKRPYGEIGIIFRDHKLSDRIGFVYSSWDADKAAEDFVNQLASIRALLAPRELEDHVVPIILDGENAWEYFAEDGIDFLNCLYKLLSEDKRFETVTVSELFDGSVIPTNIPYLFAGSWIGHSFKIWIGHEEDNRAWDLLSMARMALMDYQNRTAEADQEKLGQAWEEIYIAEGSDWCWWYGEEHSSQEDDMFDMLFRSHLSAVYAIIGQDAPKELLQPVRSKTSLSFLMQPSNFLSPTIDGEITHFYEWYDAGTFDCRKASSTMHRVSNVMAEIFFGFDQDNLYFRFDLYPAVHDEGLADYMFELELRTVKFYRLRFSDGFIVFESRIKESDEYSESTFEGKIAFKHIIELAVPRTQIMLGQHFEINLRVLVYKNDQLLETWPNMDLIKYQAPTKDQSVFWQV